MLQDDKENQRFSLGDLPDFENEEVMMLGEENNEEYFDDEYDEEDRYYQEGEYYPPREHLQGKLLDYLMNLAIKSFYGQDYVHLVNFDPELSASFLEYVKIHPNHTKFPSDEVYFYILDVYENEIEDVLGADFLEVENNQFGFNDRLVKVYEKEKRRFYAKNPHLLAHKMQDELVEHRAEQLFDSLDYKISEKVKLPSLNLDGI